MKQTTDTCNNMDESHTTRKKYYAKEYTVLLHFCEVLSKIYQWRKRIKRVVASTGWGREWPERIMKRLSLGDGNGLDYKVYTFVKTHGMVPKI